MAEVQCRHFSGYKPCAKNQECERARCPHFESVQYSVLVIHLEALGAVVRSTSLLPAIHRSFPKACLTWVTKAPAHHLLENVPGIHRLLTISAEDLLQLSALKFDVALVLDKSLTAAGVLSHIDVREIRGFRVDASHGSIVPANREAIELWNLGLNDKIKFFENQKSEQQLSHEALALGSYEREEYQVRLTDAEIRLSRRRREEWARLAGMKANAPIIGINTGCSNKLPAKKMTVEGQRELLKRVLSEPRLAGMPVVLLGGPEDTERNFAIAQGFPVIVTPTELGLRDGLVSMNACDLVFTGDSLGMHMAIGLKKWVVAWFGPSCQQEIDLYDRGVKVVAHVACAPCWKRVCNKSTMCYDRVDFDTVINALVQGRSWHTSFFKPHTRETSSSPFLSSSACGLGTQTHQ